MTALLNDLLFDMAVLFIRPQTAVKSAWSEKLGARYLRAAWSLVLALLLWGFLLSSVVGNLADNGFAFYLASTMIVIWSMVTSYAALLVLLMFIITKFRG